MKQRLIHTRFFDLDSADADELQKLEGLLDDNERARAGNFVFEQHRRRYIVSHGRIRQMLGRWLGRPPRQVIFISDANGKPRLAANSAPEGFVFNFSRSGSSGFLAFGQGCQLGVDLEEIRPLNDTATLVTSVLFGDEVFLVDTSDTASVLGAWTLKEAIAKATGEGLMRPFSSIRLGAAPPNRPRLSRLDGHDTVRWQIISLKPHPKYIAAIAAEADCSDLEIVTKEFCS